MPQGLYSDTLHRELGFPGGKGLRLKNWVLCVFLWVSNFHNDADSKPTGTQEQRPVGQRLTTHGWPHANKQLSEKKVLWCFVVLSLFLEKEPRRWLSG